MLVKILLFKILIIFNFWPAKGEAGKCRDGVTKDLTPHQLLRQDVFCSYDKETRPVKENSMNVSVNITFYLHFFTLDEEKNILDLHSWLLLTWIDIGLKWNPAEYSNVNSLHVNNEEIWQPDINIYNSGNFESNGDWGQIKCIVNPTGSVICVPFLKWSAQCIANLQHWPFDLHKCILKIGSWAHTGEQIDFNLEHGGLSLEDYTSNREWELLKASATKNVSTYDCCPNATYQHIEFYFQIKRHADPYAAIVILPSLALTSMTLATYWLYPKRKNRLALCCISILCHCLYLQYLGQKLPANGTLTPIIILLYRDSLIITSAALLLAVVVQRLSSSSINTAATSAPIPEWLNRFVGVVLDQRVGQILLLGRFDSKKSSLQGDGASLVENGPQSVDIKVNQEWTILVIIIDRLGFILSSIAYFILYIALVPKY